MMLAPAKALYGAPGGLVLAMLPAVASAAEENGAGMPQFDASTFPSQLFWLTVFLVAFFFAMRNIALPRIAEALDARRHKIDGDLEKANRHREEAEAAMAAYEKALADAAAEAQAIHRQTADEIAARAAERRAELAARIADETREAEAGIAAAKEPALANLEAMAAEVVQETTAKLAGIKVSKSDAESAVASVVAEK